MIFQRTVSALHLHPFLNSYSLGSHQVLVLEGRALQVDDPLRPQWDLEDAANLYVYLGWTQNHHVVILAERQTGKTQAEVLGRTG